MKICLTKYGLPQLVVLPVIIIAVMAVCFYTGTAFLQKWVIITTESILAVLLLFVLAFFRDPNRSVPADVNVLLAPADGRIADIEQVNGTGHINGPALRLGIFLSIFDVHINRAPCDVKVLETEYKKGKFKDARNPLAGKVNESNDLKLVRTNAPADNLIVRQISGAIARRIVCKTKPGDMLASGKKFGMIKFGSRTELYMPLRDDLECAVKVGDKVKAGQTVLARYKKCQD
jgi:phosphatidylserine decarboxylase